MNSAAPAHNLMSVYGLWSLVIVNFVIFILFAYTFFKPRTARDWRSFGAFSAFLVALFTEMYGFPAIPVQALDKAKFDAESNEAALVSAKAQVEVWQGVRSTLAARLIEPTSTPATASNPASIEVRAPVSGRVLKINQESEAVVQPGTPLIEIGDPRDLEIVADLLSSDAVQINTGASVRIDGWGGTADPRPRDSRRSGGFSQGFGIGD